MKKKIIIILGLFILMSFIGAVYIVNTVENATSGLHFLVDLHHTETLRRDFLIQIERLQSALKLKGTIYTVDAVRLSDNERDLVAIMDGCLGCHHTAGSRNEIVTLRRMSGEYMDVSHKILGASVSAAVTKEVAAALRKGDDLIGRINGIITLTRFKLVKREAVTLKKIKLQKKIIFLIVMIAPLFAAGLSFFLINSLAVPVNTLLDATRRLKSGNLDYRIGGLRDEFGEVADSFNEMVASLKKEMLEMQRTEQLKVCGEMAAGLAHEIRNPLAGIKLSIEVLLTEIDMKERDRTVLCKVIEEIGRIERLMKNLLNFARPAASQFITVNVNRMLEKTINFLERHPLFSPHVSRNEIIMDFDADLSDTLSDPQQLQQVFLNLFINAAEAMPSGGTVTVKTRRDTVSGTISVEVSDTGKGISAEAMNQIFNPFFTTKAKGTGLGLAVSMRLVEEHGGTIIAKNNSGAGGGATFKIILPIRGKEEKL